MTPSLFVDPIYGVDEQGGVNARDQFSSRGRNAISPWAEPAFPSAIGQINLSFVSVSKADVFYAGSIVNISRNQFRRHIGWFSSPSASYLANQFHLSTIYSSAVTNIADGSFYYDYYPADSASVQSVSLPSVPDQISPKSTTTLPKNPTDFPDKPSTTSPITSIPNSTSNPPI